MMAARTCRTSSSPTPGCCSARLDPDLVGPAVDLERHMALALLRLDGERIVEARSPSPAPPQRVGHSLPALDGTVNADDRSKAPAGIARLAAERVPVIPVSQSPVTT